MFEATEPLSGAIVAWFILHHVLLEFRRRKELNARWPDDFGRPLSADGVRETRAAARAFAAEVEEIDRIATSPLRRAARTAEIWAEAFDPPVRVLELPELRLEGDPSAALARVAREWKGASCGVLVGHEPGLAEILGLALTGEARPVARLSRAGTAALEFPQKVAPGGARLKWLLTRKQWMAQRET